MRCFTYSTLSRLLTASNPESGTTTYTYDSNGNLGTRTDGNGTKMTVGGYDGLNRPFLSGNPSVTYATVSPAVATNAVTYAYDHLFKGSLWSVTNTTSSTSYTYDGFGRINASTQTTGTNGPYTFAYGYSLTDQLTSMTYPSGRQVNYALDAADRVITVQNVTGGGNYAGSIGYTPAGGLTGMALGNGVTQSYTWNDRLQPTGLTVMGAATTLLQLGFYPCATNGTACASGNNGNLQSQTIMLPGSVTLTQAYSYDHLNRLTQAQETGGGTTWTQGYGYDVLGNRWVSTNTNLPTLTLETPVAQSWYSTTVPNRYASSTGWTYDNAGNVLTVGGVARSFTYDGENRQVTACINCAPGSPTATYAYDGNGQRVSKTAGGQTTTYVYDAGGNLAAEYATAAVPSPCGTQTCYVTADHLGSTRMLTSSAGAVGTRYDYQPFGQEILAGYDGRLTSMGYLSLPDATNPKYTGQERDPETADPTTASSGLDWFNVRYLDSFQGRFQSPDPGNAGADPTNPQTWNGFAYVGNNPLSYTDPSGMDGEATAIGCTAGPEGCAIGAAIDIGLVLAGIFGFGGGPPPTISPSLATPSSPILGSADDSGRGNDPLGVGGNGFMDCHQTLKGCPKYPSHVMRDIYWTIWGIDMNGRWAETHRHGLARSPVNPTPYRLFGTYWCGPGGAGPTNGPVNGPCYAHDRCFERNGLSADVNTNPNVHLTPDKVTAAKACNRALYDTIKNSSEPGATSIRIWLQNGEQAPIRILYPGTGVN